MIEHQLIQGSPEWHAHRAQYRNASDTPAVMGHSPCITRSEFMAQRATGIVPEIDAATQRRFDDGHKFEALARPLMEKIIGEDLFPIVGSEGLYSASFDGLTMFADTAAEHKTLNDTLRACSVADELPAMYREQMEHQMMVSGAGRCLFMATKWSAADELEEMVHFWYEPDMELRAMICAAWDQFAADLATYQHVEVIPAAIAAPVKDLPAVIYKLNGTALTSNLAEYKVRALELVEDSKRPMESDQDFADRIELCKKFGEAEKKIELMQSQVVGEIHDVNAFCTDLGEISKMFRQARLAGEKLVEAEKTNRRNGIMSGAKTKWQEHVAGLNKRLGKPYMPDIPADFAGTMKGLKSLSSMQNACDTLLANAKLAANDACDKIDANLKTLRELAANHAFLFADTPQLIGKANDDLTAIIKSRIADHVEAERKKEEATRERIAKEEREKAERDVAEKSRAEDALISSIWMNARRIEFDSVPYIKKAIGHFESGDDLSQDPRPRVAAAFNEARMELQNKLAAAEAKATADAEAKATRDRLAGEAFEAAKIPASTPTPCPATTVSPPTYCADQSLAVSFDTMMAATVAPVLGGPKSHRNALIDEIEGSLADMPTPELQQVAHFIDRLQSLRKAA